MEEEENKLVSKERVLFVVCRLEWSCQIHSFFIFIITIVIYYINLYSMYDENNKTLWFVDFSSI